VVHCRRWLGAAVVWWWFLEQRSTAGRDASVVVDWWLYIAGSVRGNRSGVVRFELDSLG
jgi:hypothetical protein